MQACGIFDWDEIQSGWEKLNRVDAVAPPEPSEGALEAAVPGEEMPPQDNDGFNANFTSLPSYYSM